MALTAVLRGLQDYTRSRNNALAVKNEKLLSRIQDVFYRTWDLGFTAFGGPPVHFQIVRRRFVDGQGKTPWIDEQTYQELFAICQALPGPASTKMIFFVAFIHAGFLPALLVFLTWSLPGAFAMYGLSLGVQRINEVQPDVVYALLSGLNAATVGIIALAAVQLAEMAITDSLSRSIVILGGCAGLCYNSLWYFPMLIGIGGFTTLAWDLFLRQKVAKLRSYRRRKRQNRRAEEEDAQGQSIPLEAPHPTDGVQKRTTTARNTQSSSTSVKRQNPSDLIHLQSASETIESRPHSIAVKWGVLVIVTFFASFIAILVTRSLLSKPPLKLNLFANMYLAGTVIFGGGPVVIPLLREYVVQPGWVSSRDFLIGLAIIQALPGPNFNFAVYLGALALAGSARLSFLGALLAFLGIFLPGITLAIGFQSLWRVLRKRAVTISILRGINSAAVGLVFTAVYRLWNIGYLTSDNSSGQSLGQEPFWLVVAAVTYAANAWYKVPTAVAILAGGVLGLCWYGAVR